MRKFQRRRRRRRRRKRKWREREKKRERKREREKERGERREGEGIQRGREISREAVECVYWSVYGGGTDKLTRTGRCRHNADSRLTLKEKTMMRSSVVPP